LHAVYTDGDFDTLKKTSDPQQLSDLFDFVDAVQTGGVYPRRQSKKQRNLQQNDLLTSEQKHKFLKECTANMRHCKLVTDLTYVSQTAVSTLDKAINNVLDAVEFEEENVKEILLNKFAVALQNIWRRMFQNYSLGVAIRESDDTRCQLAKLAQWHMWPHECVQL
jgi:hypothetical protein